MAKGKKTGGRRPGSPNKVTGTLKSSIMDALARAGGDNYLYELALNQPSLFVGLLRTILPIQVKDGGTEPMMPKPVIFQRLADGD